MPQGVGGFFGIRLEEARIARGLTQTALAAIIGRDSSTISSWEGERQAPDWQSIGAVAAALKVKPELFLKPPVSGDAGFFFRSNADTTLALRKRAKARMRWAEIIHYELGEWIDFPEPDFPSLNASSLGEIDDASIERAAEDCRRAWGMADLPAGNLAETAESFGITIVRESLGGVKMDGVSAHLGDRPFVFLSSDKASAARSRFDLAHEIGHLVLHRLIDPESLSKSEYQEMERQAHLFAAALLLPPTTFLRELTRLDLDGFVAMKARWGVSIAAMIMRCAHLEVISPQYKERLFKYVGARGWKTREPLDETQVAEKPSILGSAVRMVLSARKFTKDSLSSSIGLQADDIESIASLPRGFMLREPAQIIKLRP